MRTSSPFFLSWKARDGITLLQQDLQKLSKWNLEVIPERHVKLLDNAQELVNIAVVVVISVSVIIATFTIINSTGMNGIMQLMSWVTDILKLVRLGV